MEGKEKEKMNEQSSMVATKKESKSLFSTQSVHLSSLNSQALTLETSTLNSVLLALSKKIWMQNC